METIKIGFDDDPFVKNQYEEEEDEERDGPKVKCEIKPPYISPERYEKVKATFDHVVVHEFDDDYHRTEEERKAKNAYYETFKRLKKAKKTYRRIDEYVEVMRIALQCLDAVAENNGIYDPEKFKMMFLNGEIYINGLEFPKYKGKDRKSYSWSYIAEFILGNGDPSELVADRGANMLTHEELAEARERLFTPEELKKLDSTDEEDKDIKVLSEKKLRKIIKAQPEFATILKEHRRYMKEVEKKNSIYDQYLASDMIESDIEMIAKYDAKHGYVSDDDVPEFNGNLLDDKEYAKYLYELKEYEDNHIKENYRGKMMSIAEIRAHDIKDMLEKGGWDIRALYDNKEREKKINRDRKRDELKKKKLKKKLAEIDRRNSKRDDDNISSKKKKKKKKKSSSEDE
jgi:hypothetical protein